MGRNLKDFMLFGKALRIIKYEMYISLQILIVIALLLSCLMYLSESVYNPDYDLWDAIIWTFVKFVDDPADIVDPPCTVFGQIIGTLIGVVGIAIFAVPAGLIGSGFMEAMNERRRQKELKCFRKKMTRAFAVSQGRQLKQYLENLPKDNKQWYSECRFGYINNNVNVAKFQLQGIELRDILDVCKIYPEFRVKNEAMAKSIEDGRDDRYVLEHFPVNRRYGFFANRGSRVTIVSTSSRSELCIGNFSYYLAKFAGFNYISKDFDVADGESYYNNNWKEPSYEGLTLRERLEKGEKVSKSLKAIYDNKTTLRNEFLSDLEFLCKKEGSWVICMLSHIKNQENKIDIHVAHALADGSCSTILSGKETYDQLLVALNKNLQDELQLSVEETTRYPLVKRGAYCNLAYKLQNDGCRCNVLTMRVSSHLMAFNLKMRIAQFIMSRTIHNVLEPQHRLLPKEEDDMNRTKQSCGFMDQEVDRIKETIFESE